MWKILLFKHYIHPNGDMLTLWQAKETWDRENGRFASPTSSLFWAMNELSRTVVELYHLRYSLNFSLFLLDENGWNSHKKVHVCVTLKYNVQSYRNFIICNVNNALTSRQFKFILHNILAVGQGWRRKRTECWLREQTIEWQGNGSCERAFSACPVIVKWLQHSRQGQMGHWTFPTVTAGPEI